ncbi:MAG: hypothetical protein WBW48_03340, partial [Anaerolineae bacterium]
MVAREECGIILVVPTGAKRVDVQVMVRRETLRCPALANVAWSESLIRLPDRIAFEVSAKSAG